MITTTKSKVATLGNSVTKIFSIPFKWLDDDDITVKIVNEDAVETVLVQNIDYTLAGVGAGSGGSATLTVAPLSTETVTITRYVTPLQSSDYVNSGRLASENIEDDFDKLTMIAQQNAAGVSDPTLDDDLNIKFHTSEPDTTSRELPINSARISKIAGWNSSGDFTALDVDVSGEGGAIGAANQVENNLVIYSGTQGVLSQETGIDINHMKSQNLVYSSTINWDRTAGQIASLVLGGSPTLNATNIASGKYTLIMEQDATGGRVITWGAMFQNTASIAYHQGASAQTILEFVSDGSYLYPIASTNVDNSVGSYKDFAYDITTVEDDIGYLGCNGQAVNRVTYGNLYAVIGTTYGVGNGSTTFNVPDLVTGGRFRRAGALSAVGVEQAEGTAVNGLDIGDFTPSSTNLARGDSTTSFNDGAGTPLATFNLGAVNVTHDHNLTGDAETRPINISVAVGIKF